MDALICCLQSPCHDIDHFQSDGRVSLEDLLESLPADDQDAAEGLGLGCLRIDIIPLSGECSEELARGEQVEQDVPAGQRMMQQLDTSIGNNTESFRWLSGMTNDLIRL